MRTAKGAQNLAAGISLLSLLGLSWAAEFYPASMGLIVVLVLTLIGLSGITYFYVIPRVFHAGDGVAEVRDDGHMFVAYMDQPTSPAKDSDDVQTAWSGYLQDIVKDDAKSLATWVGAISRMRTSNDISEIIESRGHLTKLDEPLLFTQATFGGNGYLRGRTRKIGAGRLVLFVDNDGVAFKTRKTKSVGQLPDNIKQFVH